MILANHCHFTGPSFISVTLLLYLLTLTVPSHMYLWTQHTAEEDQRTYLSWENIETTVNRTHLYKSKNKDEASSQNFRRPEMIRKKLTFYFELSPLTWHYYSFFSLRSRGLFKRFSFLLRSTVCLFVYLILSSTFRSYCIIGSSVSSFQLTAFSNAFHYIYCSTQHVISFKNIIPPIFSACL